MEDPHLETSTVLIATTPEPLLLHENPVFSIYTNGAYRYVEYNRCVEGAVVVPRFSNGDFLLVQLQRCPMFGLSVEFPRGGIEPDELPIIAASRELAEETGYTLTRDSLRFLGLAGPCTAALNTKMHVFVANISDDVIQSTFDTKEITKTIRVSEEVFKRLILNGKIECGQTLSAYTLYTLHQNTK